MKIIKTVLQYCVLICIILSIFLFLFRNADFSYPLLFQGGDENGVYYVVKTIRDNGILLENPDVGGFSGGNMFDYFECSTISFVLVKIISLFQKNVFFITNIFYLLCYVLAGMSAYYAAGRLLKNRFIPYLVGILYAFSYFIQARYNHLWLCPMFMMPLVCLVAIWIIRGQIFETDNRPFNAKYYWEAIIISLLASGTGLYYAFFACVLYSIAFVVNWINIGNNNKKRNIFAPMVFIFVTIIGIIINITPNIIYIAQNGKNLSSELTMRGRGESEYYGLKLVQMILPRSCHRIPFFSLIAEKYSMSFPLVNENMTSSLGIVSSIGLMISLIELFMDKRRIDKTYSYIIIGLFLVGTIGGIGSVFSLIVKSPMRCYNRISVVIMFMCLIVFADFIERYLIKMQPVYLLAIIAIITMGGVYDQTRSYYGQEPIIKDINDNKVFIAKIDRMHQKGDYIFELPILDWPHDGGYSLFNGYLASDKLKWSYGGAEGRGEAVWQKKLELGTTEEMISNIKKIGYKGLYMDTEMYARRFGKDETDKRIAEIKNQLGSPDLIKGAGSVLYWKL